MEELSLNNLLFVKMNKAAKITLFSSIGLVSFVFFFIFMIGLAGAGGDNGDNGDVISGYGIITSSQLNFGDGGWAGWSVPQEKVVLSGGFQLTGGPAAVSAPAGPNSVWPHYTFGANDYGWVVRDNPDGSGSPDSYVYSVYADEPEGYEIVKENITGFSLEGWGGWSCPEGKVVLGGGFNADGPVKVSAPAGPNSDWPHYDYGEDEYGWVVQSAGATYIEVNVVCADKPKGYEIVKSGEMSYSSTGWAGWSVQSGKVVLGGGFENDNPVRTSRPGIAGETTPFEYTYADNEYGWLVQSDVAGNGYIYVIYASPQVYNDDKEEYYVTIQDAIDAANPEDVILVEAGDYAEDLTIDKGGLRLSTSEQARIVGLTTIDADDVIIEGFILEDGDGDRIVAPGSSSGAVIQENTFRNSMRGIQGDYHGRPGSLYILDNTFEESIEYGIAGTEDVTGLFVLDNVFRTSVEGIGLGEGFGFDHNQTIDSLLLENTWELSGGYAIKDYRVDGNVYVTEGGSIQDAINAAEEGTTVYVGEGVYGGNVLINKEGIVLKGLDNPVIEGTVIVSADGVAVIGFSIEPNQEELEEASLAAVKVGASNVNISHNMISGLYADAANIGQSVKGIHVYNGGESINNISVVDNIVENMYLNGTDGGWGDYLNIYGIYVQGNIDGALVENNVIKNLWSAGYTIGLSSGHTGSETPENVKVINNHFENLETGEAGDETIPGVGFEIASTQGDASGVTLVENNTFKELELYVSDASMTVTRDRLKYIISNNTFDVEPIIYEEYSLVPKTLVNVININQNVGYETIQNAINNATGGNTIEVSPGTYVENLVIDKSVTLLGPNSDISPNKGERYEEATLKVSDGNLLNATGDIEVSIMGFTINGTDANYITTSNVNWTFEKNIFENSPDFGFHDVSTNLVFHDNNVEVGGTSFLRLIGSIKAEITENIFHGDNQALHINDVIGEISGNTFDGITQGMTLTTQQTGTLDIVGNTFDGNARGFELYKSKGATVNIVDNVIKNITDSGHEGLLVKDNIEGEGLNNTIIVNNTFENNKDPHIRDNSGNLNLIKIFETNTFEPSVVVRNEENEIVSGGIYSKIQAAIDAAVDGDTIEVGPGTYEESNLHIEKNNISLVSSEKHGAIIDVEENDHAFRIDASDVLIDGFVITNASQRAIGPRNSSGAIIRNNHIVNSYRAIQGDWYGSFVNLTIENNIFETDFGVAGTENSFNLTIVGNIFQTSDEAIGIGEGLEGYLIKNNVFDWETKTVHNGHGYEGSINASRNFWGTTSYSRINNSIEGDVNFMPICQDSACILPPIHEEEYEAGDVGGLFEKGDFKGNDGIENSTEVEAKNDVTFSTRDETEDRVNRIKINNATTISREDNEPINLSELTSKVDEGNYTIEGRDTDRVMKWGLDDITLTFNPSITIEIFVGEDLDGETLDVRRSMSDTGGWTDEGLVDNTCEVTEGYCTFKTTKASYFAAIEQEETTPPATGGGGGTRTIYLDPEEEPEEPVTEPEDPVEEPEEPVEEEPEVVEETRGFITGFVVGVQEGKATNLFTLLVILGILGSFAYYRSFTVAGLSKRAENLHKKADALNREGNYSSSLKLRTKARNFQGRADKKGY